MAPLRVGVVLALVLLCLDPTLASVNAANVMSSSSQSAGAFGKANVSAEVAPDPELDESLRLLSEIWKRANFFVTMPDMNYPSAFDLEMQHLTSPSQHPFTQRLPTSLTWFLRLSPTRTVLQAAVRQARRDGERGDGGSMAHVFGKARGELRDQGSKLSEVLGGAVTICDRALPALGAALSAKENGVAQILKTLSPPALSPLLSTTPHGTRPLAATTTATPTTTRTVLTFLLMLAIAAIITSVPILLYKSNAQPGPTFSLDHYSTHTIFTMFSLMSCYVLLMVVLVFAAFQRVVVVASGFEQGQGRGVYMSLSLMFGVFLPLGFLVGAACAVARPGQMPSGKLGIGVTIAVVVMLPVLLFLTIVFRAVRLKGPEGMGLSMHRRAKEVWQPFFTRPFQTQLDEEQIIELHKLLSWFGNPKLDLERGVLGDGRIVNQFPVESFNHGSTSTFDNLMAARNYHVLDHAIDTYNKELKSIACYSGYGRGCSGIDKALPYGGDGMTVSRELGYLLKSLYPLGNSPTSPPLGSRSLEQEQVGKTQRALEEDESPNVLKPFRGQTADPMDDTEAKMKMKAVLDRGADLMHELREKRKQEEGSEGEVEVESEVQEGAYQASNGPSLFTELFEDFRDLHDWGEESREGFMSRVDKCFSTYDMGEFLPRARYIAHRALQEGCPEVTGQSQCECDLEWHAKTKKNACQQYCAYSCVGDEVFKRIHADYSDYSHRMLWSDTVGEINNNYLAYFIAVALVLGSISSFFGIQADCGPLMNKDGTMNLTPHIAQRVDESVAGGNLTIPNALSWQCGGKNATDNMGVGTHCVLQCRDEYVADRGVTQCTDAGFFLTSWSHLNGTSDALISNARCVTKECPHLLFSYTLEDASHQDQTGLTTCSGTGSASGGSSNTGTPISGTDFLTITATMPPDAGSLSAYVALTSAAAYSATAADQTIFAMRNSPHTPLLYITSGNLITMDKTSGRDYAISWAAGEFHHVLLAWEVLASETTGTAYLYLDSVLVKEFPYTALETQASITLGNSNDASTNAYLPLNGRMSHARGWSMRIRNLDQCTLGFSSMCGMEPSYSPFRPPITTTTTSSASSMAAAVAAMVVGTDGAKQEEKLAKVEEKEEAREAAVRSVVPDVVNSGDAVGKFMAFKTQRMNRMTGKLNRGQAA